MYNSCLIDRKFNQISKYLCIGNGCNKLCPSNTSHSCSKIVGKLWKITLTGLTSHDQHYFRDCHQFNIT